MRLTLPWLTLAILVAAAAGMVLPSLGNLLGWEPGAADWRLATCQLAHWDANHALWDGLAVAILGWWSETRWPGRIRFTLLAALVLIPLAVHQFHGPIPFRGLSGVACALAAAGAVCTWRSARDGLDRIIAGGLLAGLGLKILYELSTSEALFATAATWQPVPIAHLAGLGIGILIAACPTLATTPQAEPT